MTAGWKLMKRLQAIEIRQIFLASILLGSLLIAGCAQFKAAAKKDPYEGATFLPEYTQIGWLWTDGDKEPIPYVPREGDILFTSTIARTQTFLYRVIGHIGLPHHMMIVVKNSAGQLGIFEVGAGTDKKATIRPVRGRLKRHKEIYNGSVVDIRQIKRALTPEESQRLTCFAESQVGKSFSSFRDISKLGHPDRPIKTNGSDTETWFCSQLVIHAVTDCGLIRCLKNAGQLVPEDAYHDDEYDFSGLWTRPHDWTYEPEPTTLRPLRDPTRIANDSPRKLR